MKDHAKRVMGEGPNEAYCDRLVELAFPKMVQIAGRPYDEAQMWAKVAGDVNLLEHLAKRFFVGKEVTAENVVRAAFPLKLDLLGKMYYRAARNDLPDVLKGKVATRDDLREELKKTPKLQQVVAALTSYVPSKWLLEREMEARKLWRGGSRALAKPGKDPASLEADAAVHAPVDVYKVVAQKGLLGVCFSGGGIRSATFNLGVLQGFAQLGLLPWIDYISSVSGGGYIHEFFAGWILRNGNRDVVVRELIPQAEPGCLPRAPEPIQWLKRYSSYLTPSRGLFSSDTWTLVSIWMRNTLLNLIPILASFAFGLCLVHLLEPATANESAHYWTMRPWVIGLLWLAELFALGVGIWSLVKVGKNLREQERRASGSSFPRADLLTNTTVQRKVILPWLGFSVWMSYWAQIGNANPGMLWAGYGLFAAWVLAVVLVIIFAGGALGAYKNFHPQGSRGWAGFWYVFAGIAAAAVACLLGWGLIVANNELAPAVARWIARSIGEAGGAKEAVAQTLKFSVSGAAKEFTATLSGSLSSAKAESGGMFVDPRRVGLVLLPGLLLSVPYIAIELTLGLLGRDYRDMHREWLARLRAWSMLYAFLWIGVVGLTLLGPYFVMWVGTLGRGWQVASVITFVVSHGTTVLAGASSNADGKRTDSGVFGYKPMDVLALVAAPVAGVSFLLVVSFCASWMVDGFAQIVHQKNALSFFSERFYGGAHSPSTDAEFSFADVVCLLAALGVAWLFGRRVDINEFSMHTFYRNRLSRCYLGAVVPGKREPDPFTGFDGRGSVVFRGKRHTLPPFVTELLPKGYFRDEARLDEGSYEGPFPIFCTTLNLTTGDDLATQERKGTSFAFTPLYSGYSVAWTDGGVAKEVSYNGYVDTDNYAYAKPPGESRGGIHLDSAVAISGAAVNPNMGFNTNPALAFLMTLFNVRLGWWISNTRRMDMWEARSGRATPRFALWHLFLELFGQVGDSAEFVNLSDGGHFENMGLYELVRRRCKYIVVSDAEDDPDMTFGGMGAAITKCRADFGAEIDLDFRPLRIDPATGYSNTHCVVGTIQYPPPPEDWKDDGGDAETACSVDEDDDPYTGVIVYMKTSLVGDEPADLLAHQLQHPVFPHNSTANQWFTETIFEAYRRLGHHVAMTAIPPALPPALTGIPAKNSPNSSTAIPDLFKRMYAIWYPRTPEMEEHLAGHLKQYEGMLTELRTSAELAGLEAQLNHARAGEGPVPWITAAMAAGQKAYAMQFAKSLLDFMYTVYTNLQLAFPDNRVSPHAEWWICMFRRWCRVDLLQESWTAHKRMYPEEFRLFAVRELKLP